MHGFAEEVRPGDLITADFINDIQARLDQLQDRIEALEAISDDGSVAITQLIPSGSPSDPIVVGEQLQIIGRNFGFSVGGHRVFFDSIQITSFGVNSSDTLLEVTVPVGLTIPTGGRLVTLTVTDGVTTDTRSINVLPLQQTLSGDVDVLWRDDLTPNPNPNPIPTPTAESPQTVTFGYRLRSRANLPAIFTITPDISIADSQGSLQVLNAEGGVISDRRIQLNPLQEVNFAVRATIGAPGTSVSGFDLTVVAAAGSVIGSQLRSFTFDTPVEPGDDQISLAFTGATVFNLSTGSPDPSGGSFDAASNTISVAEGFRLDMDFAATFQVATIHNVTVEAGGGTTNWDLQVRTPNNGVYDESGQPVPIDEAPRFSAQPQSGASPTGQVTFRIQRADEPSSQARTYSLALL